MVSDSRKPFGLT